MTVIENSTFLVTVEICLIVSFSINFLVQQGACDPRALEVQAAGGSSKI